MSELALTIRTLAEAALAASRQLAVLSTDRKNAVLTTLASLLESETPALLAENAKDLAAGEANGLTAALLDRLRLSQQRLSQMADGVRQVASLPDPLGELLETTTRPNGIIIRKVRVPIGVIGIIYEARPNVTIDCAALCFKSGNAAILRGGKEAVHSNAALAALVRRALRQHGVPEDCVQIIPTTDRTALEHLLKLDDLVNCIIPRGGEALIRFVAEHARMPVIKHYKGVCNLYIHLGTDVEMAVEIAINAKCQRPGVCNAIENLFVHEGAAERILPVVARALVAKGVELRGDAATISLLTKKGIPVVPATEEDYFEEYLALILAVKIVPDLSAAIDAVNHYGSHHSDAILTGDAYAAERFLNEVDSATVYWNASTRFTDGYEFGFGAEIGISTDKLHARGPMGLRELTTYKFTITGTGQIRA
ncbi:MAG: glutamate-5-semialdehyde dehydrogenase [Verrucomicrobiota bacterium]|nr:glutamate-5-semialdehyde dehydrogenase [Verrucomicrobiota bacterium]